MKLMILCDKYLECFEFDKRTPELHKKNVVTVDWLYFQVNFIT